MGVADAVTARIPAHDSEGLAGDTLEAGTVAGTISIDPGATAGAEDTGAPGDATVGVGAVPALPPLPMFATKPALCTESSEVNEIVSVLPLEVNIGGTLFPEYDAATAPVADPALYSFTKS